MKVNLKKITNLSLSFVALTIIFTTGYKFVRKNKVIKNTKFIDKISEHVMEDDHNLNIVAHRGFSSICNENSLNAINRAVNHNCVDIIEIDLQITKDNEFVLYHNERVFNNLRLKMIKNVNYNELDNNCYFNFFNKISSLRDIFSYPDGFLIFDRFVNNFLENNAIIKLDDFLLQMPLEKEVIIDIKCILNINQAKELGKKLLKYKEKIYIQGASDNLELMHKLYPNFRYVLIISHDKNIKKMNDFYDGYAIKLPYIDKVVYDDDKKYFIWLINNNKDYGNLLNCSNYCDDMYIVTDNPDIICMLNEEKRLKKEY